MKIDVVNGGSSGDREADRPRTFHRMDVAGKLKALIEAATVMEDELLYQVRRLELHVRARTEEEKQYHAELKRGYEQAAFYTRTLKRYHEGRYERLMAGEKLTRGEGSGEEETDLQDVADYDPMEPWDATVDEEGE